MPDIHFGKSRPITSGYQPTLLFVDRKALRRVMSLSPEPLDIRSHGIATIIVLWEYPDGHAVVPGTEFTFLEGDTAMG